MLLGDVAGFSVVLVVNSFKVLVQKHHCSHNRYSRRVLLRVGVRKNFVVVDRPKKRQL